MTPVFLKRAITVIGLLGLIPFLMGMDCSLPAGPVGYSGESQPRWSPDGSRIVFSYGWGIFSVGADGSGLKTIVAYDGNRSLSPDISSDGTRVAYMDYRNSLFSVSSTNWEIVTAALDGSDKEKLVRHEADDLYPVWSPDDSRIAFLSDRSVRWNQRVYIASRDGSDVMLVSELVGAENFPPVWSPDGTHLAFVGYERLPPDDGSEGLGRWQKTLFTVKADGSDLTRFGGTLSMPSWSPDGNQLAYRGENNLIVAHADGSGVLSSFSTEAKGIVFKSLEWSPDGRMLLLSGGNQIFIVNVETKMHSALSPFGVHTSGMWASWSPDGARIAVSTDNRAKYLDVDQLKRIYPAILLFTTKADGSDFKIRALRGEKRTPKQPDVWDPARQQEACSNGKVVPAPKQHPGLVQDCETLLQLGHAFAGYAKVFWSQGGPTIERWRGVSVEEAPGSGRRVVYIRLEDYGLKGPIPRELGELAGLEGLLLSGNGFVGTIPAELGRLENLRVLDLRNNRLAGSIPVELENLSNLSTLDLRDNLLTGCVPTKLASNRKLEVLTDGLESC